MKKQKINSKKGISPPGIKSPFLLLLILFFIAFTEPADCDEAAEYHNLAAQSAEGNQWPDAINYERKAYGSEPANPVYAEQLAIYYNNYAFALFEKDRYDLAINYFKDALKLNPTNDTIKDNIYNATIHEAERSFKKARAQEAISLAKDCIEYNSKKPSAYVFLGNVYYQDNELQKAVEFWNKALNLIPDSGSSALKEAIAKAERELKIEGDFKTRERTYFNIVFEGEQNPDVVWEEIDLLDDARRKVKSDFSFFTDDKVTVIIYNAEQFKHATNTLDRTYGAYDGKIRLKIADTPSNEELAKKVAFHEYAHAILHILYPSNIPVWLHEGFAQLAEPQKELSAQDRNTLKNTFNKENPFNLKQLDTLLASSDYTQINAGYLTSKLFLGYIIDKYGKYKFKELLEKLNKGTSLDEAMYEICRLHMRDIEEDFAKKFLY